MAMEVTHIRQMADLEEMILDECIQGMLFTPDADGLNDEFLPFTSCEPSMFNLKVFNRWGELVYERDQIAGGMGWKGRR